MVARAEIRNAYRAACRAEIDALKPGNVHRFADGHGMTAAQFLESAELTAPPLTQPQWSVGRRVLDSVAVTRETIGTNTNLGILLLCAPLAMAAQAQTLDLQGDVSRVLEAMDENDARDVFRAIRVANPGGLGSTETHDVARPPDVSLLEAMRAAADRDTVARQYVTGFSEVFAGGLSALEQALGQGESGMWPTVSVYLHFLSSFPDSHVGRKYGPVAAEDIRIEAELVRNQVLTLPDHRARKDALMEFDALLKQRGINPGTSADLTVATLFAATLNFVLQNERANA